MKIEVGHTYRVNIGCKEHNNVIKIIKHEDNYFEYATKKIAEGNPLDLSRHMFDENSLFAENLIPIGIQFK